MNWYDFVENVRKYDLKWIENELERGALSEKEKELIWEDIQEHKRLSLKFAKKEGKAKEALEEWNKIEEEFHKLTREK